MTVGQVAADLARHPVGLVHRWNWKAAMFSAATRAGLFFGTNASAGMAGALEATLIEAAFRTVTSGFQGAVCQAFRRAEPAWLSAAVVTAGVPGVIHVLEIVVHWAAGTKNLKASVLASVGMTIVAGLFNFFAMRRGVLIVGDGSHSLAGDMRRMPRIVWEFIIAGPLLVWRLATGRR